MTTNKRWKSHKRHSTNDRSSIREAYDSAQRDYERPIHSHKVIPNNYERNDSDNEYDKNSRKGASWL